jgi:hypothetical protein
MDRAREGRKGALPGDRAVSATGKRIYVCQKAARWAIAAHGWPWPAMLT